MYLDFLSRTWQTSSYIRGICVAILPCYPISQAHRVPELCSNSVSAAGKIHSSCAISLFQSKVRTGIVCSAGEGKNEIFLPIM